MGALARELGSQVVPLPSDSTVADLHDLVRRKSIMRVLVFQITTPVAAPLQDGLEAMVSGPISDAARHLLKAVGLHHPLVEEVSLDLGVVQVRKQLDKPPHDPHYPAAHAHTSSTAAPPYAGRVPFHESEWPAIPAIRSRG